MDWTSVATLILAGVTFLLVVGTFRLGQRTVEDTRAQWRPVLIVGEIMWGNPPLAFRQRAWVEGDRLRIAFRNVGRGPALEVMGLLDRGGMKLVADEPLALAPDETAVVGFDLPEERPDSVGGRVQYSDVSHGTHTTIFILHLDEQPIRLVYQTVSSHPPLRFPWWTAVVPRKWRPRFGFLFDRSLRRQGYEVPWAAKRHDENGAQD